MPVASRLSSLSAWSCAKSWKSRTAIAIETSPASAIPAGTSAGIRKRSERTVSLLRRRSGVSRRRDLVADAPHGDDRRGIAELSPQLAHVHVDGARVAGERVAPDPLEQLVARQHEAAVVEQLPEQVELLRRQLDLLLDDPHLASAGVDRELPVLDDGALALAPRGRGPPEDRLHTRDELAWVEWLRQIVVG